MNGVTEHMRDLATHLIAYESGGNHSPTTKIPVAFNVLEKLRLPLSSLTGKAGFRVLLERALTLAMSQAAALRTVKVTPAGLLLLANEPDAQIEPESIAEGGVILLAQLLDLLVAFIGQSLTLVLVYEVWPELPVRDFDSN